MGPSPSPDWDDPQLLTLSHIWPNQKGLGIFYAAFDYTVTPIGNLGCRVIIHKKVSVCNSWDFCRKDGWILGCSREHYHCQRVALKDTKSVQMSDTLDYRQHYLTQPTLTPEDCILHDLQTITCALKDAPTEICDAELWDICSLCDVFRRWATMVPGPPLSNIALKKT